MGGQELSLGEDEREHGHALLTLRAVGPEVAIAGEDPHLVEMRPEPGRPSFDVPFEPCLQCLDRRRRTRQLESRRFEAELTGTCRERVSEQPERQLSCLRQLGRGDDDGGRPRLEGVACGETGRDPSQAAFR